MPDPEFDELEDDFGEVMAILREGRQELPTERPSDDVWAAIAAEVDSDHGAPSPGSEPDPANGGGEPDARSQPDPDEAVVGVESEEVRSIRSARSWGRRAALLTAVAAAVALIAVPLYLALGDDGVTTRRAELAALGGFAGGGEAELDDHTLRVELEGAEPLEGAFYELWLLDLEGGEVKDLRSLGRVEAGGSFIVPDDVDLERFDVVDVSVEPDDGNPDHSGDSILRGGLADI